MGNVILLEFRVAARLKYIPTIRVFKSVKFRNLYSVLTFIQVSFAVYLHIYHSRIINVPPTLSTLFKYRLNFTAK